MKKLILILTAVIVSTASFAHDSTKAKKTPAERANKKADKLKTELSLTDLQRTQVYNALLEKHTKMDGIKAKYKDSANKKGMGQEMKSVNSAFDSTMQSVLTAEQKIKYDAMKKEKADKRKENKRKGHKKGKKAESPDSN